LERSFIEIIRKSDRSSALLKLSIGIDDTNNDNKDRKKKLRD
jgi:hypothetical protein